MAHSYDRTAKAVTYRSEKSEGPTAGTETADPLEFLARVLVHIPDKGHVTTRYYGWYADRPRGMRRQAEPTGDVGTPPPIVPAPRLALTEASRRWAALLQQLAEVDPARVPDVLRRDARRGLHHAAVRDRSDPLPPPHSGYHRNQRRRAESPLNPGTVGTGHHAPISSPPGPLSRTPNVPTTRAGTFGVRDVPPGPSLAPQPPRATHRNRGPVLTVFLEKWRARDGAGVLAGAAGLPGGKRLDGHRALDE